MSDHSILAPSNADRWVQCAGSILMESQFPDESGEEAKEGEASHWVLAEVLRSYTHNEGIRMAKDFIGKEHPESGIVITEEMTEGAAVVADEILNRCQEFGLLRHMHIEERVECPNVHPLCWGTPDIWMWDESRHVLYVDDYKYGHGHVDEHENWQLIVYALGLLHMLNRNDETITVVMTIHQPRCYAVESTSRSWTVAASDLRAHRNRLEAAANAALQPDAPVQSGNHCRYCSARHTCPAARNAAANAIDYLGTALPEDLPASGLSFELLILGRAAKALEYRYDALKELAINRIQSGEMIPGYGIQMGKGNRKFSDIEQVFALGDYLGINLRKDPDAVTPAEAERRIKATNRELKENGQTTIDLEVISPYIERPETGLRLVDQDNTLAAKVFGK